MVANKSVHLPLEYKKNGKVAPPKSLVNSYSEVLLQNKLHVLSLIFLMYFSEITRSKWAELIAQLNQNRRCLFACECPRVPLKGTIISILIRNLLLTANFDLFFQLQS